jgi:hypothetical protein
MSTWITCLHASLSSGLRSLRQVVMSSALGMNELQSLNTSGMHAWRCSDVPCEDERAGQAVASSKHRDIHDRAKDLGRRGVHLFRIFVFIKSLAWLIEADTGPHHADIDTLSLERGLVAKRQRL